jgi:hypothetical protein
MALICGVAVGLSLRRLVKDDSSDDGARRRQVRVQVQSVNDGDGIRAGSLDDVVRYLTKLAEKKPGELWSAFGMDDDR